MTREEECVAAELERAVDREAYTFDPYYYASITLLRRIALVMVEEMEAAGVNHLAQHHILRGAFHRLHISEEARKADARLREIVENNLGALLAQGTVQEALR